MRLLADFAGLSLSFVANHTVDTSPVNGECTEPAVISKPTLSHVTKCQAEGLAAHRHNTDPWHGMKLLCTKVVVKTVSSVLTTAPGSGTCWGHSLGQVGPRLSQRPKGAPTTSPTTDIQKPK